VSRTRAAFFMPLPEPGPYQAPASLRPRLAAHRFAKSYALRCVGHTSFRGAREASEPGIQKFGSRFRVALRRADDGLSESLRRLG